MAFINSPELRIFGNREIVEASMLGCRPGSDNLDNFSRITDGIDRYITGIGTALSGLKSLAFGNDSSFLDAVLLEGEFNLDVSIPTEFDIQATSTGWRGYKELVVPQTTWLLVKYADLRIDNPKGYVIDCSNMIAVASFDRKGAEDNVNDAQFVNQAENLFGMEFNSYSVITRASNLVSTMRNKNHGNPPKSYVVADYPVEKFRTKL